MLGDGLAAIGMYSYSICLWYEPFRIAGFALIRKFGFSPASRLHFFLYLSGAILVGVLFSRLLEHAILKLRDRYLPAIPKATKPAEEPLEQGQPPIHSSSWD